MSAFLNYRYAYNELGLISSRSESVKNLRESYTYDALDRLTEVSSTTLDLTGRISTQTFSYSGNGNIENHSAVGSYAYGKPDGSKPHAVTGITPIGYSVFSNKECKVDYNFFNQPAQITEGNYRFELFYGANQQRQKMVKSLNNVEVSTRHYVNKYYEREISAVTGVDRRYYYIYGDNGVVALHLATSEANVSDSTYYIHTDHLGSYCVITNAGKQVIQRNHFDPWGNYRPVYIVIPPSLDTLGGAHRGLVSGMGQIPTFTLINRGFTGHEHYPAFKIINMNGRLYDPVIARFFSPDKYVANSSFTQDFNRYSYARNCPLMYTDPDGELPVFVIPLIYIVIRGVINVAVNWDAIATASQNGGGAGFGKAMGFFGLGAVDGAVSWFCPALAPVVGIGTGILNQGLSMGNFNNINYEQLLVSAAISAGTSAFSNALVNSTLGKADFFTKTLAGNMIKGAISNNITNLTTNLITSSIFYGDATKGWEQYKKTGWWQATLSGMNDGMRTHYQTNSKDYRQQAKNEFKEQMLKDRDFRKNLSTNMKELGFSGFDRFQLQMQRLTLPFTNPFDLMRNRPDPMLQLNINVEPQIPVPTIKLPNNWEIWGP